MVKITIDLDLSLEHVTMLLSTALAAQRAEARSAAEPEDAPAVEPGKPPGPAAAPAPRFLDDWVTDERTAAVRAQFALGACRYADLADTLNALPGLPVDPKKLRNWTLRARIRPRLSERQMADAAEKVAAMQAAKSRKEVADIPGALEPPGPIVGPSLPRGDWLTKDRRIELERRIKLGEPPSVYCAPLRAMPGPLMPDNRKVQARAIALGIRYVPPPKPTAAPLPASGPNRLAAALALPKEPVDTTTPIVTDLPTVRARAAVWGIEVRGASDLPAVNAKAKAIGHRPFAIEPVVPRRQA